VFACIHIAEPSESLSNTALLDCARTFSPRIEQTAPYTVVLDVRGLERIFGLPQELATAIARHISESGLVANVALASNPDAAIYAARGFAGVSVIPHSDEAKFLSGLPVTLLEPDPETAETLERWGIRRFRDLAALPETGIAARLGPEGVRLRKLARGESERALEPLQEPLRFEEAMELEYPVELLEPLLLLLGRMLRDLCTRLAYHALAAQELDVRFRLEQQPEHSQAEDAPSEYKRVLRLPVPTADSRTLLKLLQLELNAHPPHAPVIAVFLVAEPAKPRVTQNGLFVPLSPEPEKLQLTLARLAALVGEHNVGSAELLDTHRPDAFRMRPFAAPEAGAQPEGSGPLLALRRFRPPRQAHVRLESGQPVFISAESIRGEVTAVAGPWRTAGDWWTADPWNRDEWDVALATGGLYRIYRDRRGWFLEGSYD